MKVPTIYNIDFPRILSVVLYIYVHLLHLQVLSELELQGSSRGLCSMTTLISLCHYLRNAIHYSEIIE